MPKLNIVSLAEVKRLIDHEIRKNNDNFNKELDKLREKILELEKA